MKGYGKKKMMKGQSGGGHGKGACCDGLVHKTNLPAGAKAGSYPPGGGSWKSTIRNK